MSAAMGPVWSMTGASFTSLTVMLTVMVASMTGVSSVSPHSFSPSVTLTVTV